MKGTGINGKLNENTLKPISIEQEIKDNRSSLWEYRKKMIELRSELRKVEDSIKALEKREDRLMIRWINKT